MLNRFFFLALSLLFVFSSCNNEDEGTTPTGGDPSTSLNKIMPLGASRVAGARPIFESYRYNLWKQLLDDGWEFDYIGTVEDEAAYPAYAGSNFDLDHEGRGGWTSGQILSEINAWLNEAGAPDIVLFSSPGGNDALQNLPFEQAVININAIIDAIQAANPNVTIIIEQMAPARSDLMTAELTTYFNSMQQEVVNIAAEQTTSTSQVLTVDMFSNFNDDFLADNVHYNEAGAVFIADRYYEVLVDVLMQ